jgi:NADH dehydrogenase [ubiquinone] 1 alpha subcomplex assembly factor 3
MYVFGPMVIFPHTVLSWNVSQVDAINEDSLSLFSLLEPKIGKKIFYGVTQLS